jgi:hypothetical protein
MGRLDLISKRPATIPVIQSFMNLTRSQVSTAVTEDAKSFWKQTQEAWESKYVQKASELAELGGLDSAMEAYGDDLWGDATERTVDGPSAAYFLARKNNQTHTAATFLDMVQDRRKTASVSSLPDFDCLVLIVLTPRQKLSRQFRQLHHLVPQKLPLSTRLPTLPIHHCPTDQN